MNQQTRQPARISGTVRRGGGHPDRPLPDAAQAWKGGRTLIRLVDITVRSQAAAAASVGSKAVAPPATESGPIAPPAATAAMPHRLPAPPAHSSAAESSLQPIVVLALIGLIFGVLAAAIVTGRSNVDSAPDVGPAPAWRVAPLESAAGEAAGRASRSAATGEAPPEAASDSAAPEIELPDPALGDATHDAPRRGAAARHPPVARFRGHIEPDTMEARHDQPGTSIH